MNAGIVGLIECFTGGGRQKLMDYGGSASAFQTLKSGSNTSPEDITCFATGTRFST
jgi:hypothetical protein